MRVVSRRPKVAMTSTAWVRAPGPSPGQGRVGRLVVIARGERSTCSTCQQPLAPAELTSCRRCESGRTLVADVLAR